jgi:hypothetical protein
MNTVKKIIRFMIRWDGIWALPFTITVFILLAIFGQRIFGFWFVPMPLDDLHTAIEAAIIVIAANSLSLLGLWFNFRKIYTYYLTSAKADFSNLQAWQRLLILFFMYCFYVSLFIMVWHSLLSEVHILPS